MQCCLAYESEHIIEPPWKQFASKLPLYGLETLNIILNKHENESKKKLMLMLEYLNTLENLFKAKLTFASFKDKLFAYQKELSRLH